MNATLLKILIGAGLVVALLGLGVAIKRHYINVGSNQEKAAVSQAASKEAVRQAEVKANAAMDGTSRVSAILEVKDKLGGALNSSEVLNNAETDSPCLSDSRRMRIDAVR